MVRINEVKISSKALQGELILLRISGDFELSEFEISVSNCSKKVIFLRKSDTYLTIIDLHCFYHFFLVILQVKQIQIMISHFHDVRAARSWGPKKTPKLRAS